MDSPDIDALLESAAPTPAGAPDVGAIEERARRRKRRRGGTLAGASLVTLLLVVALVADVPGPRERRSVVAGSLASRPLPLELSGDRATVDIALLDGTRLRLRLPEAVGEALAGVTFGDLEVHGSVSPARAPGLGWRLDVTVDSIERLVPDGEPLPVPSSSGASAARVDREGRRLGIQFGAWAAVVSGDSLTQADIDVLMAGVALGQTPDGFVAYEGSLPLWLIDSPDAYLTGREISVSLFMRDCSLPASRPTATGLAFGRFDDPAPERKVTGVCDLHNKIEICLDTPSPLADDRIDLVDVEVLSIGSSLEALQLGRHP